MKNGKNKNKTAHLRSYLHPPQVAFLEEARAVECLKVDGYHVSCCSYRPAGLDGDEDIAEMVLYQKGGEENWYSNRVHCKAGYIVIKRSEDIKNEGSDEGKVHGDLYKSVFGRAPSQDEIVGGGFSYIASEKRWKFNSGVFNTCSDEYHTPNKAMNMTEERAVMGALANWIENGQENTRVGLAVVRGPDAYEAILTERVVPERNSVPMPRPIGQSRPVKATYKLIILSKQI